MKIQKHIAEHHKINKNTKLHFTYTQRYGLKYFVVLAVQNSGENATETKLTCDLYYHVVSFETLLPGQGTIASQT